MKKNYRIATLLVIVATLLVGSYYLGSRSQKTGEIIKPTVLDLNVPGATPATDIKTNQTQVSGGVYDYSEANNHIGENATIRGAVVDVYTSKTGTIFFDFCKSYKTCPFSAVIFASSAGDFQNIKQYVGQTVSISGTITSYQGRAEIVIDSPSQIGK
jgi:DNA/RNA endonuclease YhcR with UshA esterase domain